MSTGISEGPQNQGDLQRQLHTFSDEAYHVGLVMDAAGNLYGTSTGGGSAGLGYVWKLTLKQ